MSTPSLELTAACDQSSFSPGAPITVQVTLSNTSSQPVWVNQRMGMGYEDGDVRELFVTVYDASSGALLPVPDTERVDVHRLPPIRTDFRPLAPGEAVRATIDLAFWYPFKKAGRYRIVVTYENRYDGHEYGLQAFVGAAVSNPLEFVIQST